MQPPNGGGEVLRSLGGAGGPQAALIGEFLGSINHAIDAIADASKHAEVQKTKRHFITSACEVELEKIRSRRALVESYLDKTFKERGYSLHMLFDALDKGLEKQDNAAVQAVLNVIATTIESSPLDKVMSGVLGAGDNPLALYLE